MVSEADVIMAYRLLMGREPENQKVVEDHARHFQNLSDLRTEFMGSTEFRDITKEPLPRLADSGLKPLSWPPARVDVTVTSEILQSMTRRIEGEFLEMGATEPHWSVLTADRYRAENIQAHEAEFFASGEEPVNDLLLTAARCRLDLSVYRSCLELGCGLGRLTFWLAQRFPLVTGVDISRHHLHLARAGAMKTGHQNISFLLLNQISQYESLPPFDFFFSLIVLQHNPPPLMAFILEAILTRLAPGGAAYFQIPTYLTDYEFSADAYLDTPPMVGNAEVHCVPQIILFQILQRTGCELLEIREDGSLGGNAISNRLLVRKSDHIRENAG